jgi:3-deoxy-D-manno-octulosonic-acid transferase
MYRYIYFLLTSILSIFVYSYSLFNKKLSSRNKNENTYYNLALAKINQNNKKVIWIHAASGGEFEQVIPFLEAIDKSNYFVLLTFMSPTIFNIQKDTDLADAVLYHPFDFYWKAKRFIIDFEPNYYILNRHDIWPHHILIAKDMGVKIAIINFNIHLKSARYFWLFEGFNKHIFNQFDKIYTGTVRLKSAISHFVNEEKIQVTGDTRFNRVIKRKENASSDLLPVKYKNTKNIIFGSIIKSDYDIIFESLNRKYPNGEEDLITQNIGLIVTPHETDKDTITEIEQRLQHNKIHYQLYSKWKNENGNINCSTIIIDTVGILADLYKYARISYVGAGFGAGVHNVLEPAVYGCAVSFGPNIHILDEAIELNENGLGVIVKNSNDFRLFLNLIDSDETYNETKLKLEAFVKNHKCDVDFILNDILNES